MEYYQDKVVVVTGAGSGIGRACAIAYGKRGARVHVVDIMADRVNEVCDKIKEQGGVATGHVVDCADGASVRALAAAVHALEGKVDILQNGVGILLSAPFESFTEDDWKRVIDINIWSVIHGVRSFLPLLESSGKPAHIVNIASCAGLTGFPFTVPYSMSKFAVVGFSESLAMEIHGKGVFVSVVCPGAVRTRIIDDGHLKLPAEWDRKIREALSKYAADPDRVAENILKGVKARKPLIIPTAEVLPLWLMKRLGDDSFRRIGAILTSFTVRGKI